MNSPVASLRPNREPGAVTAEWKSRPGRGAGGRAPAMQGPRAPPARPAVTSMSEHARRGNDTKQLD